MVHNLMKILKVHYVTGDSSNLPLSQRLRFSHLILQAFDTHGIKVRNPTGKDSNFIPTFIPVTVA